MFKEDIFANKRAFFVTAALAVFLSAGIVAQFFTSGVNAQITTTTTAFAPLTGAPIGGMLPGGAATYLVLSDGTRVFGVHVSGVNLPAGTMLDIFVDGATNSQWRFAISSTRDGRIQLGTNTGDTVPNVDTRSNVILKNGATTVLSGSFSPQPSPSPLPAPSPIAAFYAPLTGATIGGVVPSGIGQYSEFTGRKVLHVFVSRVNLPGGTILGVKVGTTNVGNITLRSFHDGTLHLDTSMGATIPTVVAGDSLTVSNGSATILSGTFRAPTNPTPHPSPTVRPNRFFGGRMNGAQVVPPVRTIGKGAVFVVLNEAGTQIQVACGFFGLSSAQTSAKIFGPALPGATGPMIFDLGVVGGTSGRIPVRTFDVSSERVQQLRSGLLYVQIGTTNHANGEIRGQIRSFAAPSRFTGNQPDDIAVYRPSSSTWFVKTDTGYTENILGNANSIPVSGDFDGDGNSDAAVFNDGIWNIRRSSDGGFTVKQFGLAGDIPLRGDYDGDGQNDLAVFRPSTRIWYVEHSNGSGYTILPFGLSSDKPVVGDFDGDGRDDIAVYRASEGIWYWLQSSDGAFRGAHFGIAEDIPIAGDFDGDGTSDLSVFRPSTGVWYWLRSSDNQFTGVQFGVASDVPMSGDYDADSKTDVAVFRPSTGVWYILRSGDLTVDYRYFGISGDIPTSAR